jgi:hypothetical protein
MDRGVTPFHRKRKMKEIKEMKEEDLMKMLKVVREEIDRRRAETWEKYTSFKYPLKKTLKKEADDGERSR